MVKAEMNLFLNIPVYSLISLPNIKYENEINNNYCMLHTDITIEKDDNNISTSGALPQMF